MRMPAFSFLSLNRHLFSVVAAGGTDDVDTTGVDRGLDGLLGADVEGSQADAADAVDADISHGTHVGRNDDGMVLGRELYALRHMVTLLLVLTATKLRTVVTEDNTTSDCFT